MNKRTKRAQDLIRRGMSPEDAARQAGFVDVPELTVESSRMGGALNYRVAQPGETAEYETPEDAAEALYPNHRGTLLILPSNGRGPAGDEVIIVARDH